MAQITDEERRRYAAEAAERGICWYAPDWPWHAANGTQPDADLVCWSCGRELQQYTPCGPCRNCLAWDRNHEPTEGFTPDRFAPGGAEDWIPFRPLDDDE